MTPHPTSPERKPRHYGLMGAGIALLCTACYALTWRSFVTVTGVCAKPFCDFVDYYYPMGAAIFRTGMPVPGFLYSPFVAIVLAMFPPLGLHASLLLWGALQAASVIVLFLLFRRLVPSSLPVQLLFVALTLTSFPVPFNVMAGQVSVFLLVVLLGMLVLYKRGHQAAAAVLFACAVSIKFYPLIFLAPFAAHRNARFLFLAMVMCGALLFAVPGVLLGFGDTLRFYGALLDAFRASEWVSANVHSQYFPHVVVRLAEGAGSTAQGLVSLLRWMGFGVAAANMGVILLVQRARLPHADLWSFQLALLTIPFVLKTSWPHDFVFLPFAQALLAWWLLEGDGADLPNEFAGEGLHANETPGAARTAVKFSLLLSIVLSNVLFFNFLGDFTVYGHCAFLFWADTLLLFASYRVLLPAMRRKSRLTTCSAGC